MDTLDFVVPFVIGFVVGMTPGVLAGFSVYRQAMTRAAYRNELQATSERLEKQRRARDSGRTEAARENAGPSAKIHNLLISRPGAMEKSRSEEVK